MWRPWKRLRIPILYYHEIGADRSKHVVSPGAFQEQMAWLEDAGFEVLTLDDVVAIYGGRRPVPARAVALTFDDGRSGVVRHALPVLGRRGWPATLFLVTGWLDGGEIPAVERYSGFLSWPEVRSLHGAGFGIGSHTVTHRNLKRISLPEATREITASRRRLEDALGSAVLHFSFPYGQRTPAVERAVREAGYRSAVVTGNRVNGRFARLHRLRRVRVDGREPLDALCARLLAG